MRSAMESKGQQIIFPVVDLLMGLWRRSDREFDKNGARRAFRETCYAVLRGETIEVAEPSEDTPHDSPEWARYVAACDCKGIGELLEGVSEAITESSRSYVISDDSDSDAETVEGFFPCRIRRKKRQKINPATDRRFKANKTATQITKMHKDLEYARGKATEVFEANRGITIPLPEESSSTESDASLVQEKTATTVTEDVSDISSDVEYQEKRPKNSRPQIVPIPPLPTDYRMENEWIKKHIKSPDMLYTYVRKKSGDGIRWSSGMRKYFENNDFWEFAFDTLSSGGWHDSEYNRPINNVSKYITKVTIEEFSRHEATKHSRFEGKFKNGKELLEYVEIHCYGMNNEYRTEEYCEWFLQRMNDIGWRWNNGSTINNIPAQMSKMYEEFKEWRRINERNLAGLNANQIGDTARVHRAIERGEWKPRANGKFSAMDLKGLL